MGAPKEWAVIPGVDQQLDRIAQRAGETACASDEARQVMEKAAHGGLIDSRYPWGNDPPTPDRCDMDRCEQRSIQPMRRFLPKGMASTL